MLFCYEVPKFVEKNIKLIQSGWIKWKRLIIKKEEENTISIPVKKYKLTAQQVLDKYEMGLWGCN